MRALRCLLAAGLVVGAPGLSAQATDLVRTARARMDAHDLDSATVLLDAAFTGATERADSVAAFVARGILAFLREDESAASTAFHQALVLDSTTPAPRLAQASPRLLGLFDEQRVALTNDVVYPSSDVDEQPRRLAGPRVRYPPDLLRRQVSGRVVVALTVDTLGHAVPATIEILSSPDSGFIDPVRHMLLASMFSPGKIRKRAVRTLVHLAIQLEPGTPPTATALIEAARAKLALRQTDSALALLQEALDPITQATNAERVFGLLVMGIARTAAGQDSLARATFDTALAGYHALTDRGVELAPFLRRLADSIGLARHGRVPRTLGEPTIITTVDVPPVLVSPPIVRYPAEMQALRVGGTVTVEATVDTTGHVIAASVKVIRSSNPGFDAEAGRAIRAAVYRPGRRGGHFILTIIRQTVTFAPY